MKKYFFSVIAILFLSSCDSSKISWLERLHDEMNYESITNATGNVYAKIGDSTKVYYHAEIVYSETDQATMLIKTAQNKYVYIQGPALIEFDSINVNPK